MRKNHLARVFIRIFVSIVFLNIVICVCSTSNVFAWIGTGTSTGGGGGPGNCDWAANRYAISCAGVSWGFFKANKQTNTDIEFPYLWNGIHAVDNKKQPVKIPAECSKYGENSGIWHFGINGFGIYFYDENTFDWWHNTGAISLNRTSGWSKTNNSIGVDYSIGWSGHWTTLAYNKDEYYNANNDSILGEKAVIGGVYEFDRYDTVAKATEAYKQAFAYTNPGKTVPNEIPEGTWGFCWGEDMVDTGSTFVGDSAVLEVPENDKDIDWDKVSNNKKKETDWQDESKLNTPTYVVNNCDPEKGCWVSFRHYLERMSGTGSTEFSIERELGDDVGWTVHSFTSDDGENVAANPVKMYPGQKLCETLSFYAKSDSGSNVKGDVVQTRICAAAVATVGADIDIQIRDQQSSDRYNEYGKSDIVYAKPTDTVNIKGSYSPKYQSLYNTVLPKDATVNGRKISNNNGTKIGNMFSLYTNPAWNNAFSINLFNDEKDLGKNCDDGNYYNGTVGSADQYDGVTDYQVMHNDVGKTKKAKAVTNICEPVKNTPKQVSLTYSDSESFTANVDVGDKRSKEVSIAVPYNFSNSTEITNAQDSVVYAGEAASINYNITVGTKNNSETNGEYATPVPGAEWGLSMSYDGGAMWNDVELGRGDLNSGNEYKFEGGKQSKGGIEGNTVNIPDLPAGTVIYFRSWVTPGDSGDPINMDVDKFSGKVYSEKVRFIVAKRPSFQVWGGNIYTAKDVGLSMSVKNNLAYEADYPYNMTGRDKVRVFGSWAELSLVAEGEIKGLSSGAGLGYGTTTDAGNASWQKTIETLGGRDSNDYCLMSTLSIENDNCKSFVGNIGRSSGGSGDKSSLISDFVQEGDQFNIEGEFSLSGVDDNRKTDKGVYYYDGKDKDLSISASIVGPGVTKVVETNGLITIKDNIEYENKNDNYSNLESIPKIIIYAKNINIYCGVTRVDAVLIADENINTCDGKKNNEDVNLEARSKQLMINGSVISNTLTLGRTYGAATGKNSVIPAEIINYDTSLYLWANNQSSATTSGKLTETYINELAPRY